MMAVSPSVRNDLYNISSRWAGDEVTHEAGICVGNLRRTVGFIAFISVSVILAPPCG